jgi:hypothetical protein
MPRGPRVSADVVVWAKASDILCGHPQLKPDGAGAAHAADARFANVSNSASLQLLVDGVTTLSPGSEVASALSDSWP